jgi:pyrimidine operon attenuation protein/uracil phosphoribosyltransferase
MVVLPIRHTLASGFGHKPLPTGRVALARRAPPVSAWVRSIGLAIPTPSMAPPVAPGDSRSDPGDHPSQRRLRDDRLPLLSEPELSRTLDRLASQVLESVGESDQLVLLGIPTRGVALAKVLAGRLETLCGHPVLHGSLDPTFHRDDLERVGTRLVEATQLPGSVDERSVVLVDDVIFTGRTVRAALEALQAWGRPKRVLLLVMVDRGHRELPIQPDFCGRVVPTTRSETIQVCLRHIDGEEGVFLLRA